MSFSQIFDRFNRLARAYAPEFLVGEQEEQLREAERLIAEQKAAEQKAAEQKAAEQKAAGEHAKAGAAGTGDGAARMNPAGAVDDEYHRMVAGMKMTGERARAILGVSAAATSEQIGIAYRALIVRYHPDRTGHLPQSEREAARLRAVALNAAYAFLKDDAAAR